MLVALFLVAVGLGLLFVGGEILVRSSVILATKLGVPKLIIGLIVIGFGTSMPEMLVSVKAALDNVPQIALGNVVGSNIANVLLILGVASLMLPISHWERSTSSNTAVAVLAAGLLYLFCLGGSLNKGEGIFMLGILALYLIGSYVVLRRPSNATSSDDEALDAIDVFLASRIPITALASLIGIGLLIAGADMLISGATFIARAFGVSDVIIGLSLVAFGTSLPELVTAIVSSLKRESEVIVGNIIGSNIFNIFAILGVTLLLTPISVDDRILIFDAPLVIITSTALLLFSLLSMRIGRGWGALMLGIYIGYILFLFIYGAIG